MTDEKIVGLFFRRSQQAVAEVRSKYGKRLEHLAQNLLGNTLDAEECVNDTLLTAWNSIPPQRPESLSAWLTATLRNHCMNRLRSNLALKRGGGAVQVQLEELREMLASPDTTESMVDRRELTRLLNRFLGRLSSREKLWAHEPLTDFWMIAGGTSERLARYGVKTMGDLARLSLIHQEVLYKEFGIDAELVIDHAWGIETCQMENIKRYRPATKTLSCGQVLARGYPYEQARIVVREMMDEIIAGLVDQGLMADGLTLYVGYERLKEGASYSGQVSVDWYGRRVPKSSHGTQKLGGPTMRPSQIMDGMMELFTRVVDPKLEVRRIFCTVIRLSKEEDVAPQFSLFVDMSAAEREIRLVKAERKIQRRYGNDAIFKGIDLMEGATTLERNHLIGGHRA